MTAGRILPNKLEQELITETKLLLHSHLSAFSLPEKAGNKRMHTVPVHVIRHYYLSQVQTNRSTDSYSCQNYLFPFPLIVLGQQLAIPVPLVCIFPNIRFQKPRPVEPEYFQEER